MTSASEPPATASRRGKPSVVLGVALLLAIVAGASVWWIGHHRGVSPEETAARAELTKLGALVVMDSQREHVSSVNLATLKSPGTIDQAVQPAPCPTLHQVAQRRWHKTAG